MAASNYQVRRATVDDLAVLRQLWQQAQWPVADLEPRWREFQVVETVAGEVLGTIGIQTHEHQGKLHHEAFKVPDLVPQLRQRLWDRIASLAQLDGLHRLWISQNSALFYSEKGFEPAEAADLESLPKSSPKRPDHLASLPSCATPPPPARLGAGLAIYRVTSSSGQKGQAPGANPSPGRRDSHDRVAAPDRLCGVLHLEAPDEASPDTSKEAALVVPKPVVRGGDGSSPGLCRQRNIAGTSRPRPRQWNETNLRNRRVGLVRAWA